MIWLLVSVLCDSKCVGPKWVETQEQFTLADLLEQVTGGKYLEASVIVKTGKEEQSPMHDAVLHQPLSTFYSYGDSFVKFNIISKETPPAVPKDAVAILVRVKLAEHLPPAHDPIINNKFLLYNDIPSVLSEKNVGFMFGEVEGIGSQFLQSLTDSTTNLRYKHGMVPSIPEIFLKFNKGRWIHVW